MKDRMANDNNSNLRHFNDTRNAGSNSRPCETCISRMCNGDELTCECVECTDLRTDHAHRCATARAAATLARDAEPNLDTYIATACATVDTCSVYIYSIYAIDGQIAIVYTATKNLHVLPSSATDPVQFKFKHITAAILAAVLRHHHPLTILMAFWTICGSTARFLGDSMNGISSDAYPHRPVVAVGSSCGNASCFRKYRYGRIRDAALAAITEPPTTNVVKWSDDASLVEDFAEAILEISA